MVPDGQAKKPDQETGEESVSSTEQVQEQVEETPVKVEEQTVAPLAEVLGQAEKAYAAYREAERQVYYRRGCRHFGGGYGAPSGDDKIRHGDKQR